MTAVWEAGQKRETNFCKNQKETVWDGHQAQESWQGFSDAQKNLSALSPTRPHLGAATMTAAVSVPKAAHGGLRECCELAASNCRACYLTSTVQPSAWAARQSRTWFLPCSLLGMAKGCLQLRLLRNENSNSLDMNLWERKISSAQNLFTSHCCITVVTKGQFSKELLQLSTVWLTLAVLLKEWTSGFQDKDSECSIIHKTAEVRWYYCKGGSALPVTVLSVLLAL